MLPLTAAVSEEHIVSMFRVKMQAMQETVLKQAAAEDSAWGKTQG
jgi:hypothetical protein